MSYKTQTIEFSLALDVAYSDQFSDDWIAEEFMKSVRFSIKRLPGDPSQATIQAATSGITRTYVYPRP
jgi:hypothetical protein